MHFDNNDFVVTRKQKSPLAIKRLLAISSDKSNEHNRNAQNIWLSQNFDGKSVVAAAQAIYFKHPCSDIPFFRVVDRGFLSL